MTNESSFPFLLLYEEEPDGDSVIDGLDDDFFFQPAVGGMDVRLPFMPWDASLMKRRPDFT